jgi:sugar-specific transcriptional regulator TrmB
MAEVNKDLLMELGLTKNEVEVYLKLLMGGSITVNTIAERTGLHRQACYDALDRLLEKGFVNFVLKENKKYFQSLPPESILTYAEDIKDRISNMVPQLKQIASAPMEETSVEVYKGKNALRTVLKDIIETLKEEKGEVLVSGVEESKFIEYDKPAIDKYILDMKKFGFKEKLLAMEGTKVFVSGSQSEYKLLPKRFFNPNPMFVYGNKVVFVIWGTPSYAIIIENEKIADLNKKQFEMLWKIAKKRKG